MNKIFIYLFILTLFSLTLVSATQISLPSSLEIGRNGTLIQTCDNCSFVNITSILLPNKTLVILNQNMIKNGTTYSYIFVPDQLGDGSYSTIGDLNGIITGGEVSYKVTSTGNDVSLKLLIFLFIGGVIFLVLSLFGNEEFFIFLSGILFILAGLFMWIYGFGDLSNWYTFGIGLVGVGLGILLIFESYSEDREEDLQDFD